MKAIINGIECEGTPEEFVELLRRYEQSVAIEFGFCPPKKTEPRPPLSSQEFIRRMREKINATPWNLQYDQAQNDWLYRPHITCWNGKPGQNMDNQITPNT